MKSELALSWPGLLINIFESNPPDENVIIAIRTLAIEVSSWRTGRCARQLEKSNTHILGNWRQRPS
jgi:hypothetical protein